MTTKKPQIREFPNWAKGLVLAVLVFLFFLPALWAGFVWDDQHVTRNALMRSWDGLWKIWFSPSDLTRFEAGYWPLTYTSFWIEYNLWGDSPFGYHLNNVLLHILNTLLVWLLLRRMAIPGAWFAAAFFALHPMRAESAAWVIERKDLLSGSFYLLTFHAFTTFIQDGNRRKYALALLFFLCAMLSKSIAVTLPIALLIWFWWKWGKITKRRLLLVSPFFVIALMLGGFGALVAGQKEPDVCNYSIVEKILIAGRSFWFYVGKVFWPSNLIVIYPKWKVDSGDLFAYFFPIAAISLFWFLWARREKIGRGPFAGLAFFAVTLSPTFGFIYYPLFKYTFVALRYSYLASIGISALVSGVLAVRIRWDGPRREIGICGGALLLGALGVLSFQQARIYEDMESLFSHCAASNPDEMCFTNWGQDVAKKGRLDEAVSIYKKGLAVAPNSQALHYNTALALDSLHRVDEAISHYKRAAEIAPNQPQTSDVHNNLAVLLATQGRLEEAREHFYASLQLNPRNPSTKNNLCRLLTKLNLLDEAVKQGAEAISLAPDFAEAYFNYATALSKSRRVEEAVRYLKEALRLNPNLTEAAKLLASIQNP